MPANILIIGANGEMTLEEPRPDMDPADVLSLINGSQERLATAKAILLINTFPGGANEVDIVPLKARGRINLLKIGDLFRSL